VANIHFGLLGANEVLEIPTSRDTRHRRGPRDFFSTRELLAGATKRQSHGVECLPLKILGKQVPSRMGVEKIDLPLL
jgi:hypothetical protein